MKKHTLVALATLFYSLILSLSPFRCFTATAQTPLPDAPFGSYACITSETTYFYLSPDTKNGLFLLPKTYYVKILEYNADVCKIEYLYDDADAKKLIGYAKTNQLTFVDYTPRRPYLYYVFDLTYTIGDSATDSAFLDKLTVSCVYYGDYLVGSTPYCYVLRNGEFGYVPKPDTLSYEPNTEYADYLASLPTEPPEVSTADPPDSSPAQIAILIALCLLVPILAALILKPPKRPTFDPDE